MKLNYKLITLVVTLFFVSLGVAHAQGVEMNCRIGLLYQLSYQNGWGANKPVVVRVEPKSPADVAGLKVGDIIETVEGEETSGLSEERINEILLRPSNAVVRLTVSNFAYNKKPVSIRKECRPVEAIGEEDLATAFSHFSTEDVTTREFMMPFEFDLDRNINFINFKTFDIAPIQGQFNHIDRAMHKVIIEELQKRGMRRVQDNPDVLIKTTYSFDKNPSYNPTVEQKPEGFRNYRFNCTTKAMEATPFVPLDSKQEVGLYALTMGVTLENAKTGSLIWKFNATERLYEAMSLEVYAREFMPLAFMNFPFYRYEKNPAYVYHRKNLSYTGTFYNTKDMREVIYVEPTSPAAKGGLRAGDVVEAINGVPAVSSADKLVEGYKSFMTDAYQYRDRNQIFVDVTGFTRSMPWDETFYPEVFQLLQNHKRYTPVFSYLFGFRPYISIPPIEFHIFEVKRGNERLSLFIDGVETDYSYIELK